MHVYYKPHASRSSERAFFDHLVAHFPEAKVIDENFLVPNYTMSCTINKGQLTKALQKDIYLAPNKRRECIDILSACPNELKAVVDPKSISFDIVITTTQQTYYWEYHENQHRSLNVTRPQAIYNSTSNTPIIVPRFFQRLLRDVWRALYFQPYTIVWKDWFDRHKSTYKPALQTEFNEFSQTDKFSFKRFIEDYKSE